LRQHRIECGLDDRLRKRTQRIIQRNGDAPRWAGGRFRRWESLRVGVLIEIELRAAAAESGEPFIHGGRGLQLFNGFAGDLAGGVFFEPLGAVSGFFVSRFSMAGRYHCVRGVGWNGYPAVRRTAARHDRVEKPPRPSGISRGLAWFFMKFRGRNAHPNRPRKTMVCPTFFQPDGRSRGPGGASVWPRNGWHGEKAAGRD
jgi:hypothetical protein